LGCGLDHKEGYINIDANQEYNPDIVDDAVELSNVPDNHVDEILARDVIEHIHWLDIPKALECWKKKLYRGGKLTIQTPNIVTISKVIIEDPYKSFPLTRIWSIKKPINPLDVHKCGFTPETLKRALEEAGFIDIQINPELDIYYPDYKFNMVAVCYTEGKGKW
jgi:predicted SAM-dependent methyltransferase